MTLDAQNILFCELATCCVPMTVHNDDNDDNNDHDDNNVNDDIDNGDNNHKDNGDHDDTMMTVTPKDPLL